MIFVGKFKVIYIVCISCILTSKYLLVICLIGLLSHPHIPQISFFTYKYCKTYNMSNALVHHGQCFPVDKQTI